MNPEEIAQLRQTARVRQRFLLWLADRLLSNDDQYYRKEAADVLRWVAET